MYLLDVALHNLVCLAKKGMLLIQERLPFVSSWEAVGGIIVTTLQLVRNFAETVQLLAHSFIEIVF